MRHIEPAKELRTIRLLLDRGADVNAMEHNGFTPLRMATDLRKIDVIKELLKRGANPLIGVERGASALELAIQNADLELVQVFLQATRDYDYRCDNFFHLIPVLNQKEEHIISGVKPPFQVVGKKIEGIDSEGSENSFDMSRSTERVWDRFFIIKALRKH